MIQTRAVTAYVSLKTVYHLCNISIHVIVIIMIIHNTILLYIIFQLMSK